MENNLIDIINIYEPIIKQFKKRSDVLNGWGIAWKSRNDLEPKFENVPFGIGDGLGTTGWCVSASEALLFDDVFQTNITFRGAKAKLISIDIKEQYYGHCYNGSQNKWHTAIIVEDSGFKFVIDITCRQFGNEFIDKDIWDFETWQNKLRSPLCKHVLTDFDNKPFLITPTISRTNKNVEFDKSIITNSLKSITNLVDEERILLSDFVTKKVHEINDRLLLKNISAESYKYINELTRILLNLPHTTLKQGYSVLSFESKQAALNWIELFLKNESSLPMYLFVSDTLSNNCKLHNIDIDCLYKNDNNKVLGDKTYVIFEFKNLFGIDTEWFDKSNILLPHGIQLFIKKENIFNSGKLVGEVFDKQETYYDKIMNFTGVQDNTIEKKSNTIIIQVEEL